MNAKQLKNAILQLAIQGKLIPQDAADEPASALLARIRKEKDQLLKAGKLKPACRQAGKKDLEITPITDDEKPFEIPENWEWVRLGEIGIFERGNGIKREETFSSGKPCVRYGEMYTKYRYNPTFEKTFSFTTQTVFDKCRKAHYGDLFMALTGENKQDIALAAQYIGKEEIAVGGDLCHFSILQAYALYFVYVINSQFFSDKKELLATGDIIVHISADKLGSIPIPLPPLSEQHRIVAKIEELMPLVEEYGAAQEKLNRFNEALPEALKKSILQQAIQGKLVPPACRLAGKTLPTSPLPSEETGIWYVYVIECEDGSFYKGFTVNLQKRYKEHCSGHGAEWTKKHKPKQLYYYEIQYSEEAALRREKYLKSGSGREWFKREVVDKSEDWEPASALLAQIRKEKEQLLKAGKLKPACRQAGKKDLETTPITDEEKPFEIPESWEWVRLNSLALVARGGSPRPIKDYITESPNGVNWIKIGDTEKGGKYINSCAEKIKPEGVQRSRMVHPGDFLLTNSMSYGRPYITSVAGCIHDGWLVISQYYKGYESDFLYYLLSSPFAFSQFSDKTAGAVVQNLNKDKVAESVFPLPPLAEQKRIVAKIEELLAMVDGMK